MTAGSGKQGRGLDQVVIQVRKDGNVGSVDNLETGGGKQGTWAFGVNARDWDNVGGAGLGSGGSN